jgi:hypothetical protein
MTNWYHILGITITSSFISGNTAVTIKAIAITIRRNSLATLLNFLFLINTTELFFVCNHKNVALLSKYFFRTECLRVNCTLYSELLGFWTLSSNSECYTLSSESFTIYFHPCSMAVTTCSTSSAFNASVFSYTVY